MSGGTRRGSDAGCAVEKSTSGIERACASQAFQRDRPVSVLGYFTKGKVARNFEKKTRWTTRT